MEKPSWFFLSPKRFINQLQWSSNHSWILGLFFTLSAVAFYFDFTIDPFYVRFVRWYSVAYDLPQMLVSVLLFAFRLSYLAVVLYGTTVLLWLVGRTLSRVSSQRVLLRRLAFSFGLVLLALSLNQWSHQYTELFWVSVTLFAWSVFYVVLTVREQFHGPWLETVLVSLVALLLLGGGLHIHETILDKASAHAQAVAKTNQIKSGIRKTR